jgi:hypothetical protein
MQYVRNIASATNQHISPYLLGLKRDFAEIEKAITET